MVAVEEVTTLSTVAKEQLVTDVVHTLIAMSPLNAAEQEMLEFVATNCLPALMSYSIAFAGYMAGQWKVVEADCESCWSLHCDSKPVASTAPPTAAAATLTAVAIQSKNASASRTPVVARSGSAVATPNARNQLIITKTTIRPGSVVTVPISNTPNV